MIEFYRYSNTFRSLTDLFAALSIIFQAVLLHLSGRLHKGNKRSGLEDLLEFFILLHILIQMLMMAEVQYHADHGRIIHSEHALFRYIIILAICACSLLSLFMLRRMYAPRLLFLHAALPPLSALPLLPFLEDFWERRFPYVYIGAILLFVIRAWSLSYHKYKLLQSSISLLSIKEAIDKLNTGLLFFEPSGRILLSNFKMEELMWKLGDKIYRNANEFIENLENNSFLNKTGKKNFLDKYIYKLEDGSVFRFSKEIIREKGESYIQLNAADITPIWSFVEALKQENQTLEERSLQIKRTLDHIHLTCRSEEEIRARVRIHDVLSQKISILLHNLRHEENLSYELLKELDGLLESLIQSKDEEGDVELQFEFLQKAMKSMGVCLKRQGSFPDDEKIAKIYMDILSEAVSNAVRHGFADEINILLSRNEKGYLMDISNTGFEKSRYKEGSGIKEMRRKIGEFGGSLSISSSPFSIHIRIPLPLKKYKVPSAHEL
ncbi:MAG: hypothetical protein Q4A19_04010 [Johnsonella sp.]|nr:hypothetical protein [Johnsonella sp.]